jgi:hypothetical protein
VAKRKRATAKRKPRAKAAPTSVAGDDLPAWSGDPQVAYSNLSLHDLFQQQAQSMIESADLDEEQKQSILIAMSCPCCGAGGMSFTAKLKRRT